MIEIKNTLGIIAILLTFVGYVPYMRDILKRKTKPHIFSWFLWGFVTYIIFALQISDGAGIGAIVTLSAAALCTCVFILGFFMKGKKDITKFDVIFLLLALCSLFIWLGAKQPILSAILATTTDLFCFAPTIRKSWNNPYSETLSFYVINNIRFILATFALQNFSLVTALFPISWFLANGIFGVMLYVRRKHVDKNII